MIALTPEQQRSIERRFRDLADRWKSLLAYRSNTNTLRDNPVRRELIELGEPAVPLILNELKRDPSIAWCSILSDLTGENPVPPDVAGQLEAMTEAWLAWAQKHGYPV